MDTPYVPVRVRVRACVRLLPICALHQRTRHRNLYPKPGPMWTEQKTREVCES